MGDIHPLGNPHVQLDPRNIAAIAKALERAAGRGRSGERGVLPQRGNADFQARWQAAMTRWTAQAAPLKGVPVVVIHKDQVYLAHWLGLVRSRGDRTEARRAAERGLPRRAS